MASQPLPGSANHRERERPSVSAMASLVWGLFATESAPLPQRPGVLEFNPVNFTHNYISCSFENILRMARIQMLFFPLFATFSPSAWSLGALGTSERGFGGGILWSCYSVPLLGKKSCVGVAAKLELVRAHRGMGFWRLRRVGAEPQ